MATRVSEQLEAILGAAWMFLFSWRRRIPGACTCFDDELRR
jgi:hypothetical protein